MKLEEYNRKREELRTIAIKHLEAGVDFADLDSVYIDADVTIGEGTFIGPCVTLSRGTEIGKNCRIYQNSRIEASKIASGVTVQSSVIIESEVGENTQVGPFAYLRPGSCVGAECKVGDFVEIKNSTLGNGTKAAHLTYIGDADIGKNVNLGCGVVFVNYDGSSKYRTTVGDDCFIGCNVNLVSPVSLGNGSYIAAGSTVTEDVPEDALAIARARQRNLEGWAAEKALYRKK